MESIDETGISEMTKEVGEKNEKEVKNMNKKKRNKPFGLIDSIINKMPEIHIYSYQYAGPGTKLEERLARGDPGKNKLDVACKDHDIAYASCDNTKSRRKADKVLIKRAFERIYSKDAKLDERAVALLVSGLMSAKVGLTKIGLGLNDNRLRKMCKKNKKEKKKLKKKNKKERVKRVGKSLAFSKLIRGARESIRKSKMNSLSSNDTIKAAIQSVKDLKHGENVKIPRVLKLPKMGGNLQSILPILSALSAIGSITASTVGVAKSIKDIQVARKQLMESNQHQHNMSGEEKVGRALNLLYKPNENIKGSGFYLKPHQDLSK